MNPLFVLMAFQAAATVFGMSASAEQERVARAQAKLKAQIDKNKTATEAHALTSRFRKDLSAQLASSALRSQGGGSIARQFATDSMSALTQDLKEFKRRERIAGLASRFEISNIEAKRTGQQTSLMSSLIASGINAYNFSGADAEQPGIGGKKLG